MVSDEPTNEALIAEYKATRRKELQNIASQTSFLGKPQPSYEQMKDLWNQKRGISSSWEVEDTTPHNIEEIPRPSEGRLRDSQGNFINYETARARFFELQGRRDPLIAKRLHDEKTAQRRKQYGSG